MKREEWPVIGLKIAAGHIPPVRKPEVEIDNVTIETFICLDIIYISDRVFMTEITDIDGVGPARAGRLEDAGYDTIELIAEANSEELAEEIEVPEDTALSFIVQAQNFVEAENPEPEESEEVMSISEEVEKAMEESDDSEEPEEPEEPEVEVVEEEDEPEPEPVERVEEPDVETFPVSIVFEDPLQFDTFFAAVMRRLETVYRSNQRTADALSEVIDSVHENESMDVFQMEMSEFQLNELHLAVLQLRVSYQGNNLIEHMNALKSVEVRLNERRDEFLFAKNADESNEE